MFALVSQAFLPWLISVNSLELVKRRRMERDLEYLQEEDGIVKTKEKVA